MGNIYQDIRFAIRILWKNPGFTAVALLTLALGIGANTAIFSLVNSLLLRPLPVQDPSQITVLGFSRDHGHISFGASYPEMEDLRRQQNSPFTDLVAFQFGSDGLDVDGKPYSLFTNYVTGNFFEVLGVKPALGRLFVPSEGRVPGADPIIVLSYSLWKARLGGDPNFVGKKVLVDGHPFTVVGITPEGFHGLTSLIDARAYIPFAMHTSLMAELNSGSRTNAMVDRKIQNLHVFGRLKPAVSIEQANAALVGVAHQISQLGPDTDKDLQISVFPELRARPDPESFTGLYAVSGLFLALAAFVLVLACMNVANILLVRVTLRRREMAIRSALGGSRARLIRLLLTESVLLAILGAAGGLLVGQWLSGMISKINLATTLPIVLDFSFDWRVFGFALLAAMLTGILVGVVPAVRAARSNLMEVLRESGRTVAIGRQRFRSALVIAQVAGSLMLLIMAGLFSRSLGMAQKVDLGFDPSHLANFSFDPRVISYGEAKGILFSKQLLERMRTLPGVESTTIGSTVPFGYYSDAEALQVDGYDPKSGAATPFVSTRSISPGYFQTMRVQFVTGRDFTDADDAKSQRVAIINQAMARQYWPDRDPIGRFFHVKSHPDRPIQVVGIVNDSRFDDYTSPIAPFYCTAMAQEYSFLQTLHVRTIGEPGNIIPVVQQEFGKAAPGLALFDVGTMEQGLYTLNGLLLFQLGAWIAAALGILGLILAVVGVYGVVSYVTSQRTHEIGVRMALGAAPGQIGKMILRQGFVIVAIGLVLGLAAAVAAGNLAKTFLVSVSPTDPLTYFTVSLLLAAVALTACWIPARRATKVDPMVALRYE
jgi:predicted permease